MTSEPRYIPFLPRFWHHIINGKKRYTARNKKYGEAGDILKSDFGLLKLISVDKVELWAVRDGLWQHEGVNSPEEFQDVWVKLHPNAGWDPHHKVWLHKFEFLGPA